MNDEAQNAAHAVAENIRSGADTAAATLEQAGACTDEMADAAKKKGSELGLALGNEIRSRPFRAVAIAFGVGYLFALYSRAV